MKCSKCNKDIADTFTSKNNKQICNECLEKEIYEERRRIIKKHKRK